MTEIVNPLIINEIRVLWSDYLHKTNPGTIVKKWFQDFLFHFSPPLAHILEVKVENHFHLQFLFFEFLISHRKLILKENKNFVETSIN